MTVPRRRAFRLVALGAACVVVVALAADAFARGGGGGNFGGGGSSGGGGGDGGGGDGVFIWLFIRLIELCFRYPVIGIPLLVLVIYAFYVTHRTVKTAHVERVVARGRVAGEVRASTDYASMIRERDPAFDAAAFDGRVRAAFVKVQHAWCAQDLAPLRPFVSDGVYERFTMQIEEERGLGYRDQMDDLSVGATRIVDASFEGAFDVVTMRIAATASDYRVALATGERVSGSTTPDTFGEYWTFVRRRGAKSKVGASGLMEGSCPNCGDAIAGNQFADCKTCHARLRSGEYDWVLVEITQEGEWTAPTARALPGLADLLAADPEFCVEAMEDRASVAFWRWATAMRLGDAKPMAGLASDDVVRAVASTCAPVGGARRYVGECGVGAVEVVGVMRDGDVDHALVEATWSGTNFEARAGVAPRRLERTGLRTWLFVFERAAGAKSKIADSFSSAHCRGCGAPAEGTSSVCAYCGAPLADVNAGWTLARMTTRYEAAGRVLLERLSAMTAAATPPELPAPPPSELVAWTARVAACDGVIDAHERVGLETLARRAGLAPGRLDDIVRDALAPGARTPPGPATIDAARDWIEAAARVALADGVVTRAEAALIARLAESAGLTAADADVIVNRVKAETYRRAKEELARARKT